MPAAPIYLDALTPSAQTRVLEAAIVALEGALTVRGFQYANESDAALARRYEAEARVREAERLQRLAMPCPWCGDPIAVGAASIELGGRRLHEACAEEYDAFTHGIPAHA